MILDNYCIIYENYFTESEVMKIHACANQVEEIEGRTGFGADEDEDPNNIEMTYDIRQSSQKWLQHHIFPKEIQDKITLGINTASAEGGWNFAWNHIEDHQYTIYKHKPDRPTGDFYTWHTDAASPSKMQSRYGIRKLSSTIQLSHPEDYEGGHFRWLEPAHMFDNIRKGHYGVDVDPYIQTAPFSAKTVGTLIVFPSFVWHEVSPVSRGTRTSLVSWYHGPTYV
jgi:PKHD-type hydroxylase